MASYTEVNCDQGQSFQLNITITDNYTQTPLNIAGYEFASSLRYSFYAPNTTANLQYTIVDAANGNVAFYFYSSNTANLIPGRYVWDVLSQDTLGNVNRVVEGIFIVSPGVTSISAL